MAKIVLYPNRGFDLSLGRSGNVSGSGGGKRGVLDGKVSSASFRRFRSFCLRMVVPDKPIVGVTLTVPGIDLMSSSDFKDLWHKMSRWLAKHNIPVVWRVELQQRGMPHIHAIVFGSDSDVLSVFGQWYKLLSDDVYSHEVVDGVGDIVSLSRSFVRGASYAVQMERLADNHRAFRYLVTHTGKAKQSQLGFAGRNWGVVCRDAFKPVASDEIPLSDFDYFQIIRWLRRLTRRRVNGLRGCSSWICNPDTVRRMLDFLANQVPF